MNATQRNVNELTYNKCRICSYWVEEEVLHCPNCGIIRPTVTDGDIDRDISESIKRAFTIGGAVILAGAGGWFAYIRGEGDAFLVPAYGIAGLLVGWLIGDIIGSTIGEFFGRRQNEKFPTISPNNLKAAEESLQTQLHEISMRQKRLLDSKGAVELESGGIAWDPVADSLIAASNALFERSLEIRARIWEVMLARWENTLAPLNGSFGDLDFDGCRSRLQMLQHARTRGMTMLDTWEDNDASETEIGKACIKRLKDGLNNLDPLSKGLISQQSYLAVRGIDERMINDEDGKGRISLKQLGLMADGPVGSETSINIARARDRRRRADDSHVSGDNQREITPHND